jgi:shikimate dehydrogenase
VGQASLPAGCRTVPVRASFCPEPIAQSLKPASLSGLLCVSVPQWLIHFASSRRRAFALNPVPQTRSPRPQTLTGKFIKLYQTISNHRNYDPAPKGKIGRFAKPRLFALNPCRRRLKCRVSQSVQPAISATTRCCAVYGSPIRHSASPAMHNAAFAALGLDWCYLACEVDPQNLRAAIQGAQAMNFAGLNLTVPHKLLALEMVDVLDESARSWGAINTIRFEAQGIDGGWRPLAEFEGGHLGRPTHFRTQGFNTDAEGISRSLIEDLGVTLAGTRVFLLGAGGAGRAIALKLAAERVADLFLLNRTASKAGEVAAEIRLRFPGVSVTVGYPPGSVDLLINATSLGLKPGDDLPLDAVRFPLRQAGAVYDAIYRPSATALLQAARAAGCRTANGLGMLLHQGARAFEIWTGRPAPVAVMRRALEQTIYGN